MNIYQKLQEARIRLHATAIKKTGRNTFSNYDYMELADFLIPTQTLFQEIGLCGVVSFTPDIATLTITDMADPAQQIVITSPMGSAQLKACHEVQNIGAVETYQRRYLWSAAMEIVEHDAIDSSSGSDDKPAKQTKAAPKSAPQEEQSEPDAEVMAQFNAALDVGSLTKVMNSLPQPQKRLYTAHFNQRMNEIKKAA
jgi:hypothetical protein